MKKNKEESSQNNVSRDHKPDSKSGSRNIGIS